MLLRTPKQQTIKQNAQEFNPKINFDFKENSPFQEGIMSETFQRPDKSYEIRLLLSYVSRQRCGIITTLVSSFIGLAYKGIMSFLQQKCENALHKM